MHPELTNLLPSERRNALAHEYFVHLATIALFALSAVMIGSGALLFPSYLYLNQQIASQQVQLATINQNLANSTGKETNQRLAALSDTAKYLSRLSSTSPATAALRGVLSVPRDGITLTAFSYAPAAGKVDGKMTITGVASNRETLRAYYDALSSLTYVRNADLPISAYAKDSNIPFTITLTGNLKP